MTLVAQDLAQFVNEVKRDNETLREIDQYQRSIENLVNWESLSSSSRKPNRTEKQHCPLAVYIAHPPHSYSQYSIESAGMQLRLIITDIIIHFFL